LLNLFASRCLAQGTNAWTDTDHTCYTMTTAGSEGFLNLLPIYLDHILYPTLTVNKSSFSFQNFGWFKVLIHRQINSWFDHWRIDKIQSTVQKKGFKRVELNVISRSQHISLRCIISMLKERMQELFTVKCKPEKTRAIVVHILLYLEISILDTVGIRCSNTNNYNYKCCLIFQHTFWDFKYE
jgi:hypothetical protein